MLRRILGWVCLILMAGAFGHQNSRAELSADPVQAGAPVTIVMGIGDDADPFPPLGWQVFRQVPPAQILNADGFARGDNGPDIAWYPANGWPVVVWAWNVGTARDIAFSEWNGSGWTTPIFLASGLSDELDPRVFVETDGTVHVTWWSEGTPSVVRVITRPAGSGWQAPVQVTSASESGRRPSVAFFDDALRVAYERDTAYPEMSQEIVVSKRQIDGTFAPEIVARTSRADRLDVVIHSENGHAWVEWKDDGSVFGYAKNVAGAWNPPASEPWSNSSWIGVEDVRRSIRRLALAP
jgi:hypothetical protein